MAEEPIIIEIDDSQLDVALMKLDLLGEKASGIIGGAGGGGKRLDIALPGINRELRLILGQIPGMRDAMRAYFALKRLERGKAYLKIGEVLPAYLTIIATAVILIRQLLEYQRRLEQKQKDYELFIRRERGWTKDEFQRGITQEKEWMRSLPG